jgi:hypothetical protein
MEGATLDDEIKMIFAEAAVVDEAGHRIRWEGGDEFVLSPAATGSTLEVFVVRPAPMHELDWRKVYDPICEGWVSFVEQLRFFLERHRNDHRSTIFLSGCPAPRVYQTLPLHDLADIQPGDPYTLQTGFGDKLTGEVWYKSHYQIGLTVEGFGDGLLIVQATPASEALPDGGVDLLITAFVDDAEMAALETKWGSAFGSATPRRS